MSAYGTLVLNDGSGDINFLPTFKDGLLVGWRQSSDPVALGHTANLGYRPDRPDVNRKVTLRISVPYQAEDLNNVNSYKAVTAFVEFVVPQDAPSTDVDKLIAYVSDAVVQTQISDSVTIGQFPY